MVISFKFKLYLYIFYVICHFFLYVPGLSCPVSTVTGHSTPGSNIILSNTNFDLNDKIETGNEAKSVLEHLKV